MAKTPYKDLSSEDILSAHISGLAHSVNKIEDVLNMKTASVTFNLSPVYDQEEASLRYRIYEGSYRNWVTFSIKRNGVLVPSNEYDAHPGFGAIVFKTPQNRTSVIEASVTYITNSSTTISNLETKVSSNTTAISSHTTSISGLRTDVDELKLSGSGPSTPSLTPEERGFLNLSAEKRRYSNFRPDACPSEKTALVASNILQAAFRLDAVPMILQEEVTFTKMSISFNAASPTANNILGIYSNKNVAEPDQLLASTAVARHGTVGYEELIAPLTSPITLQPGLYWLVRWHNDGVKLNGHFFNPLSHISINPPSLSMADYSENNEESLCSGIRTQTSTGTITSLPQTFPAIGSAAKYLIREAVGTVYAYQ